MGGGGQYLKHEVFSCERRKREAMLGGGGRYELGTLRYELGTLSHTENNSNLSILRAVAASLRVNVSILIHRMHEREFCRVQARVRGSGGMLPREIFEKSVHLGAFWHIFMQFNSLSNSFIFQQA